MVCDLQAGERALERSDRFGRGCELHFLDGVRNVGLVEHRRGIQIAHHHRLGRERARGQSATSTQTMTSSRSNLPVLRSRPERAGSDADIAKTGE